MPRKARSHTNASVLRISQSSIQPIFNSNEDRDVFLNLLAITTQKFHLELFAYCLLQDQSFTLVLRTPHLNISKAMASLLISYTNYKKPQGKLFHQRFKSVPILTCNELQTTINQFKQPLISAYNGYCFAQQSALRFATAIDERCFECDVSDLHTQLTIFLESNTCSFDDVLANKQLREQCVVMLYQTTPCSLKDIGEIFNGLDQSTISKIIKRSLHYT